MTKRLKGKRFSDVDDVKENTLTALNTYQIRNNFSDIIMSGDVQCHRSAPGIESEVGEAEFSIAEAVLK
ncbi:hypothetical protein ANN_23558 [Periplaneta americana]|uniref:Per a allergen n=1 Tax=Periplaneta americana TaxID=6978 RepID=A0ABQ8SMH5_PERAM|nr:hypothetical protein ANN_23558 [Periplaneta americana]